MKNKLMKWGKILLTTSMLFSTWVSYDIASIILFGEYEYPTEK